MTEDMTREQALEVLRAVKSYTDPAWNSETLPEKNSFLREASMKLNSEIQRLEKGVDYVTPAPAPVYLPFNSIMGEVEGYTVKDEFFDFILEVAEEYNVPLTNNEPRWQDGQWLREQGAYLQHTRDATIKSGAFVTIQQYENLDRIKEDAIEVANAEKRKRIEIELELEMWQKGYRHRDTNEQ